MQKFKTVTFRVKNNLNSQTVLDDLSRFLNKMSEEGWNAISVQYTSAKGFLIVLKSMAGLTNETYTHKADFYRIKGPGKSKSELNDLSFYFNQRTKLGWNLLSSQLIDSEGYFLVQAIAATKPPPLLESKGKK